MISEHNISSFMQLLTLIADVELKYPYISWVGGTAFLVAYWTGMKDKHSWRASFFGGILSTIIAVSVLAVVQKIGLNTEWIPVIGLLVGFIGADRIRVLILLILKSKQKKIEDDML